MRPSRPLSVRACYVSLCFGVGLNTQQSLLKGLIGSRFSGNVHGIKITVSYTTYYAPDTVLSTLCVLMHLILTRNQDIDERMSE